MYLLFFYVPESHLNSVKNSLFDIGVGNYKNYDQCCWQSLGTGQFRSLLGSNPFIGKPQQLEQIAEYKVELLCPDNLLEIACSTLKTNHPYEEPAYGFIKIET